MSKANISNIPPQITKILKTIDSFYINGNDILSTFLVLSKPYLHQIFVNKTQVQQKWILKEKNKYI